MSDVEGDISYAILGILVTLDICFITNFYVIKALRRYADAKVKSEPPEEDEDVVDHASGGGFVETFIFGLLFGKVKVRPQQQHLSRARVENQVTHIIEMRSRCLCRFKSSRNGKISRAESISL